MKCKHGRKHASNFTESCNVLSGNKGITPVHRCDLKPDHTDKTHHCCGDMWERNWK